MKSKNDLFRLIRSLSKSEKRYFKLFSTVYVSREKSNYIQLFDAIEKQKEYNEEEIITAFSKENFTNRFPVAKDYLYRLILKSLRLYNIEKSAETQVRAYLDDIRILYEKGLYPQCKEILEKAGQIADRNELFPEIIQVISWTKRILADDVKSGIPNEDLDKILNREIQVLEKQKNFSEYQNLSFKMVFFFAHNGFVRNKKDIEFLNNIQSHVLLKKEDSALSFRAQDLFFHINGGYHGLKGEFEKAYTYLTKEIELWEKHPEKIHDFTMRYIGVLGNYLDNISHDRIHEMPEAIEKLKKITPHSHQVETKRFTVLYENLLSYHIKKGNYSEGLKLIPEIEEGLKTYRGEINKQRELNFYLLIFNLHFGECQYSKALKWLNNILNTREDSTREDIHCFAKIISLIVHYELGNTELLDSLIRSTYRYLSQRKKLYKGETFVIEYIKKLLRAAGNADPIQSFIELRDKLVSLQEDPFERVVFYYFNFIVWLESKIGRKSFAEIIRTNAAT